MQLTTANRKKARIKMGLQGPSGSGKTKSSLLIAYGLCNDWEKIAVIDTENRSADLYADLGPYKVLPLQPPFTPERYIEALQVCFQAGMEVIIIDSISHEWEGTGGILEIHAGMMGNSFTNWAKLTPRHNAFVQAILQSEIHIIATIRAKQDYILSEKNGKQVPEKVGLKGITREGMDYELTLVFDLDMTLKARCSKDRTQLFFNKPEFIPTMETGKAILQWCQQGSNEKDDITLEDIIKNIRSCTTNEELLSLYNHYPKYQEVLLSHFTKRRQELLKSNQIVNQQNHIANGTYHPSKG